MMKEKKHKKLSDRDIETVCRILDGWRGKLTWEALASAVEPAVGHEFTRQALSSHDRIKAAFQIQKHRVRSQKDQELTRDVNLTSTLERVTRLEAENARLSQENVQLLLQFRRWAYNASIRGLSLDFLNQPLPDIDRERTLTLAKERKKG